MKKLINLMAVMVLALAISLAIAPTALAGGTQGDKVWTDTAPVWSSGVDWLTSASGQSVFAVSFPYDNNAQVVVKYLSFNAARKTDNLDVLGQTGSTTYTTTTAAFSGGNTNYIHVNDASLDSIGSGTSLFILDDGAGTAGWGMVATRPSGSGNIVQVVSAVSGFAMGTTYGNVDLSGVTFPVGSRLFLVEPIGRVGIPDATTITKENDSGLFAARTGSPLAVMLTDTNPDHSGSGCTLHGVTAEYE